MDKSRVTWKNWLPMLLAVISIGIAIYVPFWQQDQETKLLRVTEAGGWDPLMCTGASGKFEVHFQGAPLESVYLTFYNIENVGRRPIRPDDFFEPLMVDVASGDPIYGVVYSVPNSVTWSKSSETSFEMVPTLLNPGDRIMVSIASKTPDACRSSGSPGKGWIWSGKLAGGRILANGEDNQAPENSLLAVGVQLSGVFVWLALVLALSLFYLSIKLIESIRPRLLRNWLIIAIVFVLSVANGENGAHIAQTQSFNLPWFAKPFFLAHLLTLSIGWFVAIHSRRIKA